jgi:hypothetical protein
VHESHRAESVMPGRLVAGPWTLNPGTGVRIAPRQPVSSLTICNSLFVQWQDAAL